MNGSAVGNSGTLFTIRNSDHLFIKGGTVAGSTHDSIWEYEYTDGKLMQVNFYGMEVHGDPPTNNPIWTYQIGEEKVTKEEVTEEFKRIASQLDKELLNHFQFIIFQPEEPVQLESISMTYDEAIAYLQEMIEP